jgi:hypothetical protein
MDSIVAFADILGTTERVNRGVFDDIESLDFANPVGIVARYNEFMRFAVFSDSVFVSAPVGRLHEFASVMSFLYSQWFSDAILVRGGISVGEINWVDDSNTDGLFGRLKNLSYARVYGKALVAAHAVEQRSGPGGICFLDEPAAETLAQASDQYVLKGGTDSLIWADTRGIDYWFDVLSLRLSREEAGTEARRHLRATVDYFFRLKASGQCLPDDFLYSTMGGISYASTR